MPWHLVVARSSDVYLVLTDFEAFPSGVQFAASLRWRPRPGDIDPRSRHLPMMGFGGPDGPRLGVAFADGRKASVGHQFFPRPDAEPDGPLLLPRGGGGGGDEWRMGLWLWPLPPAGPLAFVADWPAMGAAEKKVTADAGELIAASAQALQLWPVEPGAGVVGGAFGGGWATAVAVAKPEEPGRGRGPS